MADVKVLKVGADGGPSQLATGDTLGAAHGGTGQTTLALALAALLGEVGGTPGAGMFPTPDGVGGYEWATPGGTLLVGDFEKTFRPTPRDGFLECNGAAVSQATYPDLYTAIGHEYGQEPAWTLTTSSGSTISGATQSIAYGNGMWMMFATSSATYYISTDNGLTWSTQTHPYTGIVAVTYGNGLWVTVGATSIYTSTTGLTSSWTSRTSGVASSLYAVKWNGTEFIAAGGHASTIYFTRSTNGTSWTAGTGSGYCDGLLWFNSLWIYAGGGQGSYTGGIWTSPTGTPSLTNRMASYSASKQGGMSIVANGAGTVAVYYMSDQVWSSTNGTSWTSRTLPTGAATGTGGIGGCVWDPLSSEFRIFTLNNTNNATIYWTSPDGATWTYKGTLLANSSSYPTCLVQDNDRIIGANNNSGSGYYLRHHYVPATEFQLPTVAESEGIKTHIKAEEA
jgi:hypothetical protein